MIRWKATSVNGLVEYEQEAESFKELFDALDGRGIISDPDFPLYDTALLEKYGKSLMMPVLKTRVANLIMKKLIIS